MIKSGNYLEQPNYEVFDDQDWVSIEVNLEKTLVQTVYSPDSIFVGLTKIGALFALSKIFTIFTAFHEYRFERQLEKDTEQVCADLESSKGEGYQVNNHLTTMTLEEPLGSKKVSYKELYSYTKFAELVIEMQRLKEENAEIKKRLRHND